MTSDDIVAYVNALEGAPYTHPTGTLTETKFPFEPSFIEKVGEFVDSLPMEEFHDVFHRWNVAIKQEALRAMNKLLAENAAFMNAVTRYHDWKREHRG